MRGCPVFFLAFSLLVAFSSCQYQQVDVAPGEGTNPQGDSTAYTRSVFMDANHKYLVKWDFDADGEHITFMVYVETRGWVGFGLSSNGGMKGSDIVIGWIKNGQPFFKDCHATGEVKPVIDDEQNYELLEGSENRTHTILKFRRKLETCDLDDKTIKNGTMRFIYAWGPEDPSSYDDIRYHGPELKGTRSVYLSSERPPKPVLPNDITHMDFLVSEYNVPVKETTYWCEAFKIPKLNRKHHIIKIEPVVEKGNEGFVHHILLMACYGDVDEKFDRHTEVCRTPNMPVPLQKCNEVVFTWTVGAGDFYWPERAGYSLWGSEHDPKFFLMEMHYDNPGLKTGLRDASGLKLVLTSTPREFDSGVIQQGHRYDRPYQVVPPHFNRMTHYGHCPQECITEALKDLDDGIRVFGNLLHLHLVGYSMRLRHFRGDQELPVIDNDEEYDFNLQETRHIQPEVHVKAGDSLVSECIYRTEHKTNVTVGGLATSEEMCLSFVMYYPRFPLALCESYADLEWLMPRMSGVSVRQDEGRFPHYFVDEGPMSGQSFVEVLAKENWKQESRREKYQQLIDQAPLRVTCEHAGGYRQHNDNSFPNRCIEKYRYPDICNNQPAFEPRCGSGTGIPLGSVFFTFISLMFVLI